MQDNRSLQDERRQNSGGSALTMDLSGSSDDFFEPRYCQGMHRLFFQSAPDPMIATDEQGRILQINREGERQFGYLREELLGKPLETLVPECDENARKRHLTAFQDAPGFHPLNQGAGMPAVRKDGSNFPVNVNLNPIRTINGIAFFLIARNLREREAAKRVRRHLAFERAVAGLSARFINLPADQVDNEITHGLKVLTEALDTDRTNLGTLDPETGILVVTHTWTKPGIPDLGKRPLTGVFPWLEDRIRRGEITFVDRPSELPPEAQSERLSMESIGQKSSLVVPFSVGGRLVGGLGTGSFRDHQHWDDAIVSRVQDVADIFANALTRKKMDEDLQSALAEVQRLKDMLENENALLRESERGLRELSGRLISSQEEERRRVARELHDNIGQQLAILAFHARGGGSDASQDVDTMRCDVCELHAKIKKIAGDVSKLSHRLHSSELDYLGLPSAAQHLCRDFESKYRIEVDALIADLPSKLDTAVALCFYRILQEALRNVAKHSQATHVDVDLLMSGDALIMTVSDNGKGVDAGSPGSSSGLGLLSMRERMNLIGGHFELNSSEDSGTTLRASAFLHPLSNNLAQSR